MSILSVTAQAQELAESLMVDQCAITRASETPSSTAPTTVYSGKCRVRTRAHAEQPVPGSAGTSTEYNRIELHIPVSAEGVEFNDKVTITSSINPTVEGDVYYVAGVVAQSAASAQRLVCERRASR